MRGERFKKRLPKYIGKISDLDDTFFAEDKEFYRLENDLDDFLYGLIASLLSKSKNPEKYLKKFEKDYGLESVGSIDDRIRQLLLKIGAKKVTTEEVVLEICKSFDLPGVYIQKYKDYAFLLELYVKGGDVDLGKLHEALREVVPAHLEDRVNVNFLKDLKLKTRAGDDSYKIWLCGEHPCGDIPYPTVVGQLEAITIKAKSGQYDSRNYYGYAGSEFRSGELRDKIEGTVYIQNFDKPDTYDFGGDN